MFVPTMPNVGDSIKVVFSGREDGIATVLAVYPYTGRYTEFFTHVMRYTAEKTLSGWMEIAIDVESERKSS